MWTFKAVRASRLWPFVYWLPTGTVVASHWFEIKTVTGRSMQVCPWSLYLSSVLMYICRKPTLNPNSSLWRDVALFRRDVDADATYHRNDIVTLR